MTVARKVASLVASAVQERTKVALAEEAGVSSNTIERLTQSDQAASARLETVEAVLQELGYRLVVREARKGV